METAGVQDTIEFEMSYIATWIFGTSVIELTQFVITCLVAVVCGFIIGLERESKGKPAGLRTLVLICLGSNIIVQVSVMLAGSRGDPSRVAAQIVSGIGFIGAGAILQHSEHGYVAGLTTAASIWVTAAVGMVVGCGHYMISLAGVIIVVCSLKFLKRIEGILFYTNGVEVKKVQFQTNQGKTRWTILGLLEENMLRPEEYRFFDSDPTQAYLELHYVQKNRNHRHFLAEVANLPFVLKIS